jgi:hypothetical protein
MSPTIIQINKKVNQYTENLNSNLISRNRYATQSKVETVGSDVLSLPRQAEMHNTTTKGMEGKV